jgi:hypothetical protein
MILAFGMFGFFFYMMDKEDGYEEQAKANLKEIYAAQVNYKMRNGQYASSFTDLEWEPQGRSQYAYHLPDEVILNSSGESWEVSAKDGPFISKYDFKAVAITDYDHDPALDAWAITSDGEIISISHDCNFEGCK